MNEFVPTEPQPGMQNQFELETDPTGMYVVDEHGTVLESKSDILALRAFGQIIQSLMHMPTDIREFAAMERLLTFARGPQNEALPVETSAIQVGDKYAVRITSLEKTLERDAKLKQAFEENEKLRETAKIDALTGITNKGEFLRILHREINRAIRTGSPLGMIMYDGDNFKEINDTQGHPRGDVAIKILAGMTVRDGDTIARYGGEEFSMVVIGNKADTLAAAERNRERIAVNGEFPNLTASFGFMNLPAGINLNTIVTAGYLETQEQALTYLRDNLIKMADIASYVSKSKGKNQVTDFETALKETLTDEEYANLPTDSTQRFIEMAKYADKVHDNFKYNGDRENG